jgi:dienelactone hydrolase
LDYQTELADHRAALAALRARTDVDPSRIVIFGASMGSNLAPLLAQDEMLAGVAVWGGGARTWAERTLAFERNRIELGDGDLDRRAVELSQRFRFIAQFLIEKRRPHQIADANPDLAGVAARMGVSEAGMFGRPLSFHWQAQVQNWAGAWSRVNSPVLALVGEFDWFEDPAGVLLIEEIVNRRRPGTAQARIIAGHDHHFSRFADRRSAFQDKGGVIDPAPAMNVLLPWLAQRLRTTAATR